MKGDHPSFTLQEECFTFKGERMGEPGELRVKHPSKGERWFGNHPLARKSIAKLF